MKKYRVTVSTNTEGWICKYWLHLAGEAVIMTYPLQALAARSGEDRLELDALAAPDGKV